jgi:thiamine pyrophosphate-dependent acetolactate synthase large subunit-like protein
MTDSFDPLRRLLLKGSVIAGAAGVAMPFAAGAVEASGAAKPRAGIRPPSARLAAAERDPVETGTVTTGRLPTDKPDDEEYVADPGSDFMVDVLRKAGIKHVALMPGSTFRGLQESLINYAHDENPDIIVCMHEEVSAAAAHGYAKVSGEMMACLVHSNVGLQHASMAIYDAWCDKAPMLVLAANVLDATQRRPGVEWVHAQEDVGSMVRDFTKWDDNPVSLQHFAESTIRACQYARTPPYAPVLVVADADLQEHSIPDRSKLSIPTQSAVVPPGIDPATAQSVAEALVAADKPMIAVDRAIRSKEGMANLVRLAELLNAPVVDLAARMNMPNTHYLGRTPGERNMLTQADVLLGLELVDPWGMVNSYADLNHRSGKRRIPESTKTILIGTASLLPKANVQDVQRYFSPDVNIAADVEAGLPALIAAVEQAITPERRAVIAAREASLREAHAGIRRAAVEAASLGWDASPITSARLSVETWDLIKDEPWALVSDPQMVSSWPLRLWDFTEPWHHIGGAAGFGVGYQISASVGSTLAHKEAGRFTVNFQGDGDLLMLPMALWSLAHHELPQLILVVNNKAWHQEVMHIQRMTNRRNRGIDRFGIGTQITDPEVDHAAIARGFGVWAEGPISDPAKLRGALKRALAVVKSGKPALLDIVMEPR